LSNFSALSGVVAAKVPKSVRYRPQFGLPQASMRINAGADNRR